MADFLFFTIYISAEHEQKALDNDELKKVIFNPWLIQADFSPYPHQK